MVPSNTLLFRSEGLRVGIVRDGRVQLVPVKIGRAGAVGHQEGFWRIPLSASWVTCFWPVASARFGAGIFHLMTHAFFKALLFLSAGSVIHAMGGEQDMWNMGGLSKKIKATFICMLFGTIAIAGFPPFAAFFSKDSILFSAYNFSQNGKALYAVGLLAAVLTSFYMFRLIWLTFFGEKRYDEHKVHVHESPLSMTGPLMILALPFADRRVVRAPSSVWRQGLFRGISFTSVRRCRVWRRRSSAIAGAYSFDRGGGCGNGRLAGGLANVHEESGPRNVGRRAQAALPQVLRG